MMQVTHCTLYNYQLGDQQHTPITGYNVNSYTVHATMLNTCSVYLSHCSYGNQLLCDAIKAVVLATAATVLAVPLFSQPASWNHTIRKLCVYLVRDILLSRFMHAVSNGSWKIDLLLGNT